MEGVVVNTLHEGSSVNHAFETEGESQRPKDKNHIDHIFLSAHTSEHLDPKNAKNLGIFASYLAVGFCQNLTVTPVALYMVETLNASSAEQSVVTGLTGTLSVNCMLYNTAL